MGSSRDALPVASSVGFEIPPVSAEGRRPAHGCMHTYTLPVIPYTNPGQLVILRDIRYNSVVISSSVTTLRREDVIANPGRSRGSQMPMSRRAAVILRD